MLQSPASRNRPATPLPPRNAVGRPATPQSPATSLPQRNYCILGPNGVQLRQLRGGLLGMPAKPLDDPKIVLVVEDDDDVRQFVVTVLSRQGYRTVESSSGIDALLHTQPGRPKINVLVTDVSLLDTDGIALAEYFASLFPEAGVVIMSGHVGVPRSRLDSLAVPWAFVQKPFHLERLIDAVRGVLDEAGDVRAA